MLRDASAGPNAVICCFRLPLVPVAGQAQVLTQKGFVEAKGTGYPQTTAIDDTQAVGEALLRYEAAARPAPWLRLNGSIDARADTHQPDGMGRRQLERPVGEAARSWPSGASTPRSREAR